MTQTSSSLSQADRDLMFSPLPVGGRTAPNRLVAHPMEASDAGPNGSLSQSGLDHYWHLAEGGWGMVFVEATSVVPAPLGRLGGLVLSEETAASFETLVAGFKARAPEALLLLQITHSGRQSHPSTGPVSVCPDPPDGLRYISTNEIEQIRQQHVEAALLAEKIGFDGIDYKLCNGYLGTELLRPANTRNDRWGGSWQNRLRFVIEGYQEIKARLTSDRFVVGSRIHYYERRSGGCGTAGPDSNAFDPRESHDLVRVLGDLGAHYVSVTGGGPEPLPEGLLEEEQQARDLLGERPVAQIVHDEGLAMAVIGSGYSALGQVAPLIGARRIRAGYTDMVGFGRQTYVDPLYPAKIASGEAGPFCTCCGLCVKLLEAGRETGCAVYNPHHREVWRQHQRQN